MNISMSSEPVRIIAVGIAILLAALPHLATFGVPITQEQVTALSTFLPSVLVIVGGETARRYVTPVK